MFLSENTKKAMENLEERFDAYMDLGNGYMNRRNESGVMQVLNAMDLDRINHEAMIVNLVLSDLENFVLKKQMQMLDMIE